MQRASQRWASSYRHPKKRTALLVSVGFGAIGTFLLSGGATSVGLRSPLEQIYWAAYARIRVMNDPQPAAGLNGGLAAANGQYLPVTELVN